jgi:ATP-binding cassette subfamily B protein
MIKQRLKGLDLQRALRFVWEGGRGWISANVLLFLIQGALPPLSLYLLKLLIDAVSAGLTHHAGTATYHRIELIVGLSALVALVSALCSAVTKYVNHAQSQALTDYMHGVIHAKSKEVDLEYYENSQYYDTLHRALEEAPYRPAMIVNSLVQLGQSTVSLVAIAGLLLSIHWSIGAILLIAAAPGVVIRRTHARKMYGWIKARTNADRMTQYLNWLLTRDTHAKEIRLFGLGELFVRRFREQRNQLRGERLALNTRRYLAELGSETLSLAATYGLYAFMSFETVSGAITLGSLVMYLQAVQRAQGLVGLMMASLSDVYENNLFLSSLYEFLDLQPRVLEPARPVPVRRPLSTGIRFDHVSFRYPNSERNVLDDVTFAVRPGEHVALVGENGAGKSTLIKLLCRLYDVTDGGIYLDGHDLREYETASLRQAISVVFQDYAHYQLTACENIWLGNIDAPPDPASIAAAARKAGADAVIERLSRGYETTLGKWFEGGEELSVGEWQKVALARAFLRDAEIIVLDEPTSAMDAKAEYELFQRFHQLTEGRTAILISHRLSTVRMADCIYVLEHGRIIESGTHDHLIGRRGRYADLFERQAQYYR